MTKLGSPELSIEFFPPRDEEGRDRLVENVAVKLAALGPEFFSVTYGAGGSTRDGTRQTVLALQSSGQEAVPHLSMGADDQTAVHSLLDDYRSNNIRRIVALRGDQPSGIGSYKFNNAQALIEVIRQHSGDYFDLIVAAYPEIHPDAKSASSDMDFFQAKVAAGASRAVTQYFYNVDAYEDFLNRCMQKGVSIPIVPGIMPITDFQSLTRFSDKAGAEIPRWLRHRLAELADDPEGTRALGVEFVTGLCERLLQLGVPGFHFYSLNRWGATTQICSALGFAARD
ncbi:MAG: methylenetetrahydrofolate reductase [NAD(P)H] [Pseudomonadales bacterium]|nr:methylenetetrahydrofolate reductase [NAD(P)H] [Pseudomonadales bacterium]